MNVATRKISAAAAAIAIVLMAVWYLALFRPESSKLSSAHRSYASTQAQIAQLTLQVSSLQATERQASSDKVKLATLDAAVPKVPDLQNLLDQLHALATSSGVQLTTVDPASTANSSSSGTASQSTLQSLTIGMNASGSYRQLMAFFSGLDTMARTVVINNVSIGAGTGGLTAELSTQIFYQA